MVNSEMSLTSVVSPSKRDLMSIHTSPNKSPIKEEATCEFITEYSDEDEEIHCIYC